jgi:hypothetical protein
MDIIGQNHQWYLKEVNHMFDAVGGRKFIFSMFVIFLGFILVIARLVPVSDWFVFVNVTGATYIGGNLGDTFLKQSNQQPVAGSSATTVVVTGQ